ncbi:phage tail tape measure protein [Lysinibacillus sp. NPDC047702]|uniref:phage tail tape measure protein n=1 Tax=unclassified Lysinibacillus TaxID=2636778 RepID=UPI003CFDEE82
MATIQTAIQIQDRLSQPMRAMHNAVSIMVQQMEAMHTASGNLVDTSRLHLIQRELASANEQFNRIESEVRNADTAQQEFNNNIRDGTSAAEDLASKIQTVVGAYLSIQGLKKGADIISGWLESANVINTASTQLNNVMRNAGAARAEIESVIDKAGQIEGLSTFGQETLVAGAGELATYLESGKAIEKMLGTLADYAAGMGGINADARQMTEYATQLGKALDGQYDGLRKKGFDVSEAQKKIIENGTEMERVAVISDIIAQSWNGLAQALANTPQGQLAQMANNFDGIKQKLGNEVYPAVVKLFRTINSNMPIIEAFMTGFARGANVVMEALGGIVKAASWVGSVFVDNWSLIAPVIGTVSGALATYAGALLVVKAAKIATTIWTGLQTFATGLLTATTWASVEATFAATAATWGLNAALAANPIFIIIMAIVVLIGIIYLAVAAINYFADTSISATGIVAGIFMVLGVVIYNVVASSYNLWATFAEFFQNFLTNPVYSVKKLFFGLVSYALDSAIALSDGWKDSANAFKDVMIGAINKVIQGFNWLMDLLPSDISAKLGWQAIPEFSTNGVVSPADALRAVKGDSLSANPLRVLKASLKEGLGLNEPAPDGYKELSKMELKSVGDAWNTGYDWGANLFSSNQNKIGNVDAITNAIDNALALGDKLDKGNDAGKKTAANTKKAADGIKMLNEDLKYLRDIAEREAINRYTTAEINIDARSENHINKEMDLDGIIDRFTEKAEEAAEMLAEGGPTDV